MSANKAGSGLFRGAAKFGRVLVRSLPTRALLYSIWRQQMIGIAAGAWLACKCKGGVKLRRSGTSADYESINDCEQFLVREPFSCDALQINGRTRFIDDTWQIREGEALLIVKEQGVCVLQHKSGRVGELVAQSTIRTDSSLKQLATRPWSVGATTS
ncbi:g4290 [Coccomyxa viridis]|uniref:G4290 protein n=1 Tax=Coccomyxa viridis TaxID=1274662 RepID=A0ABP1FWV6_9CHLO